jgi:choice-of-anchor B domain-containing protein
VRSARTALALLAAVVAGCGGGGRGAGGGGAAAAPAPTPTPSPISLNMGLLAHLDLPTLTGQSAGAAGSGNWGYTTPDGRRFALTGTSAGLSIVEVTDPERPRNVALIPGPASSWREIKTYRQYAYVTTEARHGLDIVSLRDPDRPVKIQTWNQTFMSAHSLWIDVDRGLLFANGADGRTGGMRVLDLARNPEDPREVGAFRDFYVHDSYNRGNVLYASAINNGFLALLDVRDPSQIAVITRFPTGGGVTHNSWLTRDGRYLFTTDECTDCPVRGWDLIDPAAPRRVAEYLARAGTIPHNVMIDGDRLLIAHYTEGVHLLDVTDPERPRLLGFYDTDPGSGRGFAGCWGAYIFPGSDLIVASDIGGGLFVIGYSGR